MLNLVYTFVDIGVLRNLKVLRNLLFLDKEDDNEFLAE